MVEETKKILTVDDLDEIKCLVEAGMQEEAVAKLCSLSNSCCQTKCGQVFEQVGTLTRDLHNAIKAFAEDERIQVIAKVDMPRASERLASIIEMTNKAASRTLDAVDACDPLVKQLQNGVDKLLPAWNALMHGRIDRDNFVNNAKNLCEELNTILLAQDYQDLTGQMIQKVITLVAEVEEKLLTFLKNFTDEEKSITKDDAQQGLTPQGPALESVKEQTENVASSQDEVDDLLASLGF